MEEELRIVLVVSAISDLVILNINNNFDRNISDFFDKLALLAGKLNEKNLFKGKLLILVRDVH